VWGVLQQYIVNQVRPQQLSSTRKGLRLMTLYVHLQQHNPAVLPPLPPLLLLLLFVLSAKQWQHNCVQGLCWYGVLQGSNRGQRLGEPLWHMFAS
jgi:hypothetical protein